jgi:hypothetical protein
LRFCFASAVVIPSKYPFTNSSAEKENLATRQLSFKFAHNREAGFWDFLRRARLSRYRAFASVLYDGW